MAPFVVVAVVVVVCCCFRFFAFLILAFIFPRKLKASTVCAQSHRVFALTASVHIDLRRLYFSVDSIEFKMGEREHNETELQKQQHLNHIEWDKCVTAVRVSGFFPAQVHRNERSDAVVECRPST